jgi:hypothetical protein
MGDQGKKIQNIVAQGRRHYGNSVKFDVYKQARLLRGIILKYNAVPSRGIVVKD